MDERFKQLAVQAKIGMVSEQRLQDYAELIVQMCISDLMVMHEMSKDSHNYYHYAANQLTNSYRTKNDK